MNGFWLKTLVKSVPSQSHGRQGEAGRKSESQESLQEERMHFQLVGPLAANSFTHHQPVFPSKTGKDETGCGEP